MQHDPLIKIHQIRFLKYYQFMQRFEFYFFLIFRFCLDFRTIRKYLEITNLKKNDKIQDLDFVD